MPLFRKKETYNEQMLREAGLDRVVFKDPTPPSAPVPPAAPAFRPSLRHPVEPGEWDASATTTAPGILGDHVAFTVLADGDLVVEDEMGDGDLSPLADAIEQHLSPPYTAVGSRWEGDLWGVGANAIEVATISFPDADVLELSEVGGQSEFRVDGEPSDAAVPVELQRLGERIDGDFSVEASRIDGDEWEVKVSPL